MEKVSVFLEPFIAHHTEYGLSTQISHQTLNGRYDRQDVIRWEYLQIIEKKSCKDQKRTKIKKLIFF